jgi:oligopeptide transport system permease protein
MTPALPVVTAGPSIEARGLWQDSWDRFCDNRAAIVGGGIVLAIAVFSCIGPWLVSIYNGFDYDTLGLENRLANPSWQHPLGTDILGRDLLARLLYGSRISLMVGFISTSISLVIGVAYGAIAGFLGGHVDEVMMRAVDVLYSLPDILLIVVLMALFERSLLLLLVALGATSWLTMARIVRGQVLSLKNEQFVEAARCIGVSNFGIVVRHILPNTLGPIIVIRYSHHSFDHSCRSLPEFSRPRCASSRVIAWCAGWRRSRGNLCASGSIDRTRNVYGCHAGQSELFWRRIARRARSQN